jgi:Domain of unknown function (DUF222)
MAGMGVAQAATHLVAALAGACQPPTGDSEAVAALREYGLAQRQLDYQCVRLVAQLDRRGVFTDLGYLRLGDALADLLGLDRALAYRRARLAGEVIEQTSPTGEVAAPRLPATATAFETGEIGLAHVEVIAAAMRSGPATRISAEDWAGAEQQLVGYAIAGAKPADLKAVAQRLLGLLDQDGTLPTDDNPAAPSALRLSPHPDGGGMIRGRLDALDYATVATAIDALAKNPVPDTRLGPEERQAEALVELCRLSLDHGELPDTGGQRPHLNITIPLAELEARARGALLDYPGTLTPTQLRMLACDAAVIPAVLGGAGQPLDLGRAVRTATPALRRALIIRDQGCAFPGCHRPPARCDVHHIEEWAAHHGATSVHNCCLLCRYHHRLIHTSGWHIRIRNGIPEFIPPKWIDPSQKARRKPRPPTQAAPHPTTAPAAHTRRPVGRPDRRTTSRPDIRASRS